MDREIVVKWFEFCRVEDKCSTDCPYFDNTGSARECTNKLAKDVLILLKEQEAKEPSITQDQEGIWAACQKCGSKLRAIMAHDWDTYFPKFCSECGQKVKW